MQEKETHKKLFVNISDSNIEIALLEDSNLVEFTREIVNNEFTVGDIYVGRVKKILPGLNAAFIDIGHPKDAFLHYLDLGVKINTINKFVKNRLQNHPKYNNLDALSFENEISKNGNIKDVLTVNQLVLVQIIKESISTKGPRVSGEISLAGRFFVLIPFSNQIMVSQKIKDDKEKNRLKEIIKKYKPRNIGVIIRTVSENQGEEELRVDMENLMDRWNKAVLNINGIKFPKKVVSEYNRITSMLRDLLNDSFEAIYINDSYSYNEIRSFIQVIAPERVDIVKLHQKNIPLFEYYGIDKQIRSGFGKIVAIKSGIYLVIEHTEALHVIDVNSGHRMDAGKTQEENVLHVNMEAAIEIARQLRLRDIGGIIVIDFIDMHTSENQKILYNTLKEEMKKDRACHTILPPNKFGLVQLTRQRVRPSTDIEVKEKCPSCQGTGKIKPPLLFIDEIESNLQFLVEKQQEKELNLIVHPFLYAYLTKGFFNIKRKWKKKYKCHLTINYDASYNFLEYRFFNDTLGEINMWTYVYNK
ncbi:MAG: Rne/Rng family ribonuclease [Bacteroidales bacterium]|nr:Rne/Rng family ribonuclease [Bacteroidales bacterium]